MELTVAKADLQKELQLCQGVVEKRSTIPILSNVLLRAEDGRLQMAATDLDVTILSSCPARVTTPGGVTIEAKRLFDIVRSLPDEDVHITLQENNSLLVDSGTAKFRLLGLPAEDYPTLPTVNATESYDIPLEELKTMVAKVKFAITHEETRFQLNGALLKVQPAKMEMVATDGHRMALINFPQGSNGKSKSSDLTILIPRKALEEIMRLEAAEDGTVRFGASETAYEIMRIDPHQRWYPVYLLQPLYNLVLMAFFEWGVAVHDLNVEAIRTGEKSKEQVIDELKAIGLKARRQVVKDYIAFPLLSGRAWKS